MRFRLERKPFPNARVKTATIQNENRVGESVSFYIRDRSLGNPNFYIFRELNRRYNFCYMAPGSKTIGESTTRHLVTNTCFRPSIARTLSPWATGDRKTILIPTDGS